MVNVISKTCNTPHCPITITNKYDGYCFRCYIYTFPDKPVARNYKTKERAVTEFVTNRFSKCQWIADKKVADGCSKRRPDLLLDLGYQVLMLEIDENQHQAYDCSCENKRLMELSQDIGHRPVIFIRFNPDGYIIKNTKIPSCWENNKKGICIVEKSQKSNWENRLSALGDQIKYWINPKNQTEKTVEVINLFFDQD